MYSVPTYIYRGIDDFYIFSLLRFSIEIHNIRNFILNQLREKCSLIKCKMATILQNSMLQVNIQLKNAPKKKFYKEVLENFVYLI